MGKSYCRSVTKASENPILVAIIETIASTLYDSRRKTAARSSDMRETAEMHRKIYRAIRAHKPQDAHDLMEQHLRMAQAAQALERPTGRKASAGAPKSKPIRSVSAVSSSSAPRTRFQSN